MNTRYINMRSILVCLLLTTFGPMRAVNKDAWGIYLISSPQNLVDFAAIVNNGESDAPAVLTADLDMTGVAFTPIGNQSGVAYSGTFDGQGFCINRLSLTACAQGVGIFGYADGATIRNLVAGPNNRVRGNAFVGGLVGDKVGSATLTIEACGHEGMVICNGQNGAAFVGCVHAGNLVISHCYNTGRVQGGSESAIFCGWMSGSSSAISDSYNSGTITRGVDGQNYLYRSTPTVTNVYDVQGRQGAKSVSTADLQSGAFAWRLNGNSPDGVFRQNVDVDPRDNHPTTSSRHAVVYACGHLKCDGTSADGTALTYSNTNSATYDPHQFDEGICKVCHRVDEEYLYPDYEGYYRLSSPYALRWFAAYVNASTDRSGLDARITADLDMTGLSFQGIGSLASPYSGEFDGGGHTITNLSLQCADDDNIGFVNVATCDAYIHDFTLGQGCTISGHRYVGGFVGKAVGSDGDEIMLERLGFEGVVSVGADNGGAIIGCVPNNNVVTRVTSCYSTGRVNGSSDCGALSGWSSRARFINCYVRLTGRGWEQGHDVSRGFTPIFRNCYAYGAGQTGDGLGTFTLDEMHDGTLLRRLGDAAFTQTVGQDEHPVLR